MNLGLESGNVKLEEHSDDWQRLFICEKLRIQDILSESGFDLIEHIGSTAIPNIKAKPIIDILLVANQMRINVMIEKLLQSQYKECSFSPRNETLMKKMNGTVTTYYLHVIASDQAWEKYVKFRDCLINHPCKAKLYSELKQNLAERFSKNREAYTKCKAEFVKKILIEYDNVP